MMIKHAHSHSKGSWPPPAPPGKAACALGRAPGGGLQGSAGGGEESVGWEGSWCWGKSRQSDLGIVPLAAHWTGASGSGGNSFRDPIAGSETAPPTCGTREWRRDR